MSKLEKAPLLAEVEAAEPVAAPVAEERCSTWKKVAFAIGGPPNQLTHTLIGFQLNAFLLQYLQLQPTTVGAIVLAGRAWDALMDPTVGIMTTRTRSRYGSFRPWLIGGTLPLALSFLALWSVPPWYTESGKTFFVLVAYLLYQLSISMYYVPYTALTMHLSHHPADVQSGTMYRVISETLAVFGAALLTKAINPLSDLIYEGCKDNPTEGWCVYGFFDAEAKLIPGLPHQFAYIAMGAIVGVICLICGFTVSWFITEQKVPSSSAADAAGKISTKPERLMAGFGKVFASKSYRVLTLMFIWVWMAVAMIQANFLVYAQIPGGLEVDFDDAADLLLALLGTTLLDPDLVHRDGEVRQEADLHRCAPRAGRDGALAVLPLCRCLQGGQDHRFCHVRVSALGSLPCAGGDAA
jgi:Na+/melibiose symporter-like transporter